VILRNHLASGLGVFLWLYDYSTCQPEVEDGGSSLDFNAASTILLPNHLVNILAADPNAPLYGGNNDPSDSNRVPWQGTYFGSSSGSSFPDTQ
jgi:hypothetical protein